MNVKKKSNRESNLLERSKTDDISGFSIYS
jgi:hypothetical protein